jgi:hypothetical protein
MKVLQRDGEVYISIDVLIEKGISVPVEAVLLENDLYVKMDVLFTNTIPLKETNITPDQNATETLGINSCKEKPSVLFHDKTDNHSFLKGISGIVRAGWYEGLRYQPCIKLIRKKKNEVAPYIVSFRQSGYQSGTIFLSSIVDWLLRHPEYDRNWAINEVSIDDICAFFTCGSDVLRESIKSGKVPYGYILNRNHGKKFSMAIIDYIRKNPQLIRK